MNLTQSMATNSHPRLRVLHVNTEQGHSGALVKDSQHVFTYAPEILDPELPERAISLTMPLRAASWSRARLLPAFQTFLPEGFLRNRIIERLGKAVRVDDMALLAFGGENAIGRLRVSTDPEPAERSSVRESLTEILSHEGTQDLFEYLCDKYLISSGISGVQPKVMVAVDADLPNHIELDSSLQSDVIAVAEVTKQRHSVGEKASLRARRLIVKVAGDDYPCLPVNEFHCLSIAQACGTELVPLPEFWLSADQKRLIIERFDIDAGTGRYLGFEDMVSLQGKINEEKYESSYEHVAAAVRLNCSESLVSESLRRLFALITLSVVLRNGDAHLKNFGLLYTDPNAEDVRLSPAYDLVTTTVYLPGDQLALKLGGRRSWPSRMQLDQFGKDYCDVSDAGRVVDEIVDAAMSYRPQTDDPIWTRQREQIAAAASSLSRGRMTRA